MFGRVAQAVCHPVPHRDGARLQAGRADRLPGVDRPESAFLAGRGRSIGNNNGAVETGRVQRARGRLSRDPASYSGTVTIWSATITTPIIVG